MAPPSSPRAWFDAVSWHLRGIFATDSNRRIGFRARELWQPAEIEARRGLGRDLATEVQTELRVDPALGYLRLSASAMPSLDHVRSIGHAIINNATPVDGESIGQKEFFRIRVATYEERVALLRVALDRRMLAMAASYLGVLPVISEADFFCSFPTDGPFTKSQLWHCDPDASDVFKLFIYCDDVTQDDGPFELVDAKASERVRHEIGYRYAGRRYRVADDVMASHTQPHDQHQVLGPAPTAFAVDTVHCFHRGSRIVDKTRRRVMATVCYCTPNGYTLPRRLRAKAAPLANFAASFSADVERAALGLPLAHKWI